MLSLTIIDNNKWISEGISRFFAGKFIQVRNIGQESLDGVLSQIAGTDVLITELTAYGRDVQFFTELLLKVQFSSPATRIVVLTELNESAVISYVASVLPKVTFLDKQCSLKELSNAVLGLQYATAFDHSARRTKQTLSPREFGLLRLFGQTSNLTDIGHSLRLSCKTISHHRQSIIRKLNCSSNKEFFSRLNRMGYQAKNMQ
ncbi:LuxR C-terminal-related transcriptional regulator [Pantoea sp.]|uniref:LuxR C-terminal-related transcriptional regulator n=1 Tax=Pantoea sp. TaxID=69393 RepID=UPI0031D002A5